MRLLKEVFIVLLTFFSGEKLFCQAPQDILIIQEVIKEDKNWLEEYESREFKLVVVMRKGKSKEFWIDLDGTREELEQSLGFYHSQGRALIDMIHKDDSWIELLNDYPSNSNQFFRISKGILSIPDFVTKIVTLGYRRRVYRRKNGWNKFYNKYPQSVGIYEFSKPTVDENKAIIYVGLTRGNLTGVGRVIFLEKLDDQWRIVHKIEIWVS